MKCSLSLRLETSAALALLIFFIYEPMALFMRWWLALLLTVSLAMDDDEWPACTNTWGHDRPDAPPQ